MDRADFDGGLPRNLTAKMLRSKPAYRSLSERDCSERRAVCHQQFSESRQSRSSGGTCRWPFHAGDRAPPRSIRLDNLP